MKEHDKTDSSASPESPKAPSTSLGASSSSNSDGTPDHSAFSINRLVSFGLLLAVIIFLGIVFYRVMASFLIPMFLAALLVVIFEPFHQWFLRKCGGRETLAAALTTISILLTVLVPIGVLFSLAIMESQSLFRQSRSPQLVQSLIEMRKNLGLDMPLSNQFRRIEARFDSLHEQLTKDEMEKQRLGLSEILQNAAEIAEASNLTWPPEIDSDGKESSETPNTTADYLAMFYLHANSARELEQKADWELPDKSDNDVEFQQRRHVSLREYQRELSLANDFYEKFKDDFLGGRLRALFTQAVNPSAEQIESYANSISKLARDNLPKLGGATSAFVGSVLIGTAIMVFSLYFFLLDGDRMLKSVQGLSPLDDEHETELIEEFGRVSRAVAVATLLSALTQGVLAGIGFWFCGLESIFLLTLLSAVLAMVPFVGAASVWIPCSLYLYFVDQNLTAAIGLAIYGVAVISMADNVIKPMVLHGQSNLHPLLALLSVIGGVSALGPIGIVVGPMVVVFLQTLLKILRRELDGIEHDLDTTAEAH
jgi:predicted PurR-regulated permease PerM